ncbi:MAG TPA: alpha-hydroxy acid oxidase [Candidatus Sulfotelmatobacter sp.]|nr:alpha-hydroxy acid oxidase [Candidatus Sulfotelmatobacter sp.]
MAEAPDPAASATLMHVDVQSLRGFEPLARERLSAAAYAYYAGGSWDEQTLRENEAAYARRTLIPRVLVDVGTIDPGTTMLGTAVSLPVALAPAALQGLAHPEGEYIPARAASRAKLIYCLSTFANRSLETVAAVGRGTRWFQLYVLRDRGRTAELVARAAGAGYRALMVTVDLPQAGYRERELREPVLQPGELGNVGPLGGADFLEGIGGEVDPTLAWDDLAWIRSLSDLPLVIKGILDPADATRAVEHGAAGIVVSNHGGRQLDRAPASLDALEAVVEAVGGRAEVYLDGGVRRGTDVVMALAMGARAVMIGRPYLYALAAGGEAGVNRCVEILDQEIRLAMAMLGAPTVAQLTRDRVR